MNDEKLSVLIRRFAVAAQAHQAALEDMDEDRANAHSHIISGLYAAIIREGDVGREALLALLDSESQVVAGMAAVFSLGYNPSRSVEFLRRLAEQDGLLGFRASVALERWECGVWEWP
jgi:oligoribonuclease (3'-5' exoribonuclease)